MITKKSSSRVIEMEVDGVNYLGLEIDSHILGLMKLRDGELLDTSFSGDSLILKKTGIIGVTENDT